MGHRRIARGGRHRTAVGRLVRRPWRRRTDLDPPAGVFATASIGGASGLTEGNPQQLLIRPCGVAATLAWFGGVTFVPLKLVSALVPLRVSREHEPEGLDISQHGEATQWIPHPNTFFLPSGWAKLCPDSVLPMF